MSDVLDQFSVLDPDRMERQADASLKSNFAVLDPAFWRSRYNAEHGAVIDQWGVLDPARMLQQLSGGSLPDWLPIGALVYADFVNGHYWAGGAEVSVDTLLTENLDAGPFNSGTAITGDGLVGTDVPTIARTYSGSLLNSFTVIVDEDCEHSGASFITQTDLPGYNFESDLIISTTAELYCGTETPNTQQGDTSGFGRRKYGATFSDSGMKLCTAGGAIYILAVGTAQAVTDINFSAGNAANAIKTIAFYSGIKSDADLQALTAP